MAWQTVGTNISRINTEQFTHTILYIPEILQMLSLLSALLQDLYISEHKLLDQTVPCNF